jgi:hypothetical protein
LRFFTGTLEGSDARVGVVAGRTHARVYFCGGDSSYKRFSRWIPGALDAGGDFTPDTTAAMGWAVSATIADGAVTGSLAADDAGVRTFHAAAVQEHTIAGLYEGMSPCGKVGLIISQASPEAEPVPQGACIGNGNVDIHQVNPVVPLTREANGTVMVEVPDTAEMVGLTAAVVAD